MTGYLAIRKSVYDAQSAVRKLGFSVLGDAGEVELAGQGGVMNKGTADFYVHGDTRWGAKQICAIGAYAANVASLDDAIADLIAEPVAGERYRVLRGFVFGWLVGRNAIVWPEAVPDGGTGNRGQELLTANSAPAAVKFLVSLDGWTPVGE